MTRYCRRCRCCGLGHLVAVKKPSETFQGIGIHKITADQGLHILTRAMRALNSPGRVPDGRTGRGCRCRRKPKRSHSVRWWEKREEEKREELQRRIYMKHTSGAFVAVHIRCDCGGRSSCCCARLGRCPAHIRIGNVVRNIFKVWVVSSGKNL